MNSEALASEANAEIAAKLKEFENMREHVITTKNEIIASAGSTDLPYEVLKTRIIEANQALIRRSASLRAECLVIYEESFKKLQPEIDAVFAESAEFRNELPQYVSQRLEYEVRRLNTRYLESRKKLITVFFENEMSVREAAEEAVKEFESKTDDWMAHKYKTIIEDAKGLLSIENRIDFNQIFHEFREHQEKFTQCFQKNMQNLQLVIPPDHFHQDDLDNWWEEVSEILKLHSNFLKSFLEQVRAKIDERVAQNEQTITYVREQLNMVTDEATTEKEISWLLPLQHLVDNYNNKFFDKLSKYISNREAALNTAFSSAQSFLQTLIDTYNEFAMEMHKDKVQMQQDMQSYDDEMQRKIAECEAQIQERINEISGEVNDKNIAAGVEKCKKLLGDIADQYRAYYTSCIARIDQRKPFITEQFESYEEKLLEQMKMRKTAGPTSASRLGRRSARRRQVTPRSPRRGRQRPRPAGGEVFRMTLADGSKYEEVEPLDVIPAIEDFIDEEAQPTTPRGRRSKTAPRKRPVRSPSRRKGKEPEPQELEVPKLILFEFVPTVNEKPVIWVYVPEMKEIAEYSNPLRNGIITSLHMFMTEESVEAEYVDLRSDLSKQLQERMRIHAPRLASMDLNVREARVSQLETRKLFMEKHFKQTAANFNKDCLQLKASIQRRKDQLMSDCNSLHQYVEKLKAQKTFRHLSMMTQSYRSEEKSFNTRFQKEIEQMFTEIQTLANNVAATNARFMAAVERRQPPFSKDERELCAKYLAKMNEQIDAAIENLNNLTRAAESETSALRKEVSEEFERLLPYHKMDLEFIEALGQCQVEARARYESLCFRNKQSENDVVLSLNHVKEAQTMNLPPQDLINKQFEVIDLFRLLVIRRSKFLGILKSNIPSDPILVNIDLTNDEDGKESPEERKKKLVARQRTKKLARNANSGSQVMRNHGPALELGGSLRKQIDLIGADMIDQAKSIASNYYKKLKARKFEITRSEIESDQKKCLAAMKKQWGNIISNSDSIVQSSGEHLAQQIINSVQVVRDSVTVIFNSLDAYYDQYISETESDLFERFENELSVFSKKRETMKSKLTARLADPNNLPILQSLIRDEQARELEESQLISSFYSTLTEIENSSMRSFTSRLPIVVKATLKMFDAFVLGDDLVSCPVENAQRAPLAQMIKDQVRRLNGNEPFDPNRPFRIRHWPQLNTVMPAIESVLSEMNKPTSQTTSRRGRRTATQKTKPVAEQVPEKTDQQVSLDTGLSRAVIVERNRIYERYEQALSLRLAKLRTRHEELTQKSQQQNQNWRLCVLALRPDCVFPPTA